MYFIEITPKLLRRRLLELEKKAHHIYAVFANSDKGNFYISHITDMSDLSEQAQLNPKSYSIPEFFEVYPSFVEGDAFALYIDFRSPQDRADEVYEVPEHSELINGRDLRFSFLQNWFEYFLRYLCQARLCINQPFLPGPDDIQKYGLTPRDVTVLAPLAEKYNAEAAARYQATYDFLKKIDCIVK